MTRSAVVELIAEATRKPAFELLDNTQLMISTSLVEPDATPKWMPFELPTDVTASMCRKLHGVTAIAIPSLEVAPVVRRSLSTSRLPAFKPVAAIEIAGEEALAACTIVCVAGFAAPFPPEPAPSIVQRFGSSRSRRRCRPERGRAADGHDGRAFGDAARRARLGAVVGRP